MKTIMPPNQTIPTNVIEFNRIDYSKPIGFIRGKQKGFLVKKEFGSKDDNSEFSLRAVEDFGDGNAWGDGGFKTIDKWFLCFSSNTAQFIQFDSNKALFVWLAEDEAAE